MARASVDLVFSLFDELADQLVERAEDLAAHTKDALAAEAVAEAPRRTGYLASTIEVTDEGVAVGAEYANIVHDGAAHMAGNPFLTRAAERVRPGFEGGVGELL